MTAQPGDIYALPGSLAPGTAHCLVVSVEDLNATGVVLVVIIDPMHGAQNEVSEPLAGFGTARTYKVEWMLAKQLGDLAGHAGPDQVSTLTGKIKDLLAKEALRRAPPHQVGHRRPTD